MSKEPKIVHACNHLIVSKVKRYGEISMIRGTSPNVHDSIPRNIKIIRIDSIRSANGKVFKKGYHYNQSISKDIIEWAIRDDSPAYNEEYIVSAAYIYTSSTKHKPEECPRCNGNGWYVALVSSDSKMAFVEGAQKLVQDLIKIINTEWNGEYGSTIKDVLAKNVYSETDINNEIASSIAQCEVYLKEKQNKEMYEGVTLEDDEILERLEVRQVYFVRETSTYVISLVIHSRSGRAIRFNFKA